MLAYAKKTLVAHKATNCVTDFLFEESLVIPPVANWGPGVDSTNDSNSERSLMGVPISIKGIPRIPRLLTIILGLTMSIQIRWISKAMIPPLVSLVMLVVPCPPRRQ